MKKTFSKTSIKSITLTLLFLFSSIGASVLINPVGAAPNSAAAPAAAPLTALEANWAYTDGNQFAQDYNPQNQINSSNAQYLGLSWLFPLPTHPTALISISGGLGVDTTPLIVNGTIYAVTQFGQVFALNAANGNVLWTDVLPLLPNSTLGQGTGANIQLHLHQGMQTFTTKNFGWNSGGTATYWISAPNHVIYAINALNGKYEMNFSYYHNPQEVQGNSPTSTYAGAATTSSNIVIDSQRGIIVTGMFSPSTSVAGRCFQRGWNLMVSPPALMWTSYCSPPQPNSNLPLNPNWDMQQVNNMTGAQIFYPGPAYNSGGNIPGSAVVDLKTLSPSVLNATLYDDWGYSNQSPSCLAATGGMSTGATGAGWGGSYLIDQKTGLAYVNTGNRGPYAGPCNPGPDLWQAAILALNDQTGAWVWGFETSPHDTWDWDCSWYQGLGNETINGVNTEVLFKTCKNGYVYELNAANGKMIFAWTPPSTILPRCQYCYILNPLNRTQMTEPFATPGPAYANFVANPSFLAGFESTASYSPVTNLFYVGAHNVPALFKYIPINSSNYATSAGETEVGGGNGGNYADNATVIAINMATGQMVWQHPIPLIGFRGGLTNSGNIVFVPLSSGDFLMLNAQTGALLKDLFIGGPMNVVPSIGATASGQIEVVVPITAGLVTWGTGVPGDLIALTLQNVPASNTVTTTAVSTSVSTTTVGGQTITTTVGGQTITTTVGAGQTATITTTVGGQTITTTVGAGQTATTTATATATVTSTASGGGVGSTTLYAVAAIAVILAISTGYLAMRGRKPAS